MDLAQITDGTDLISHPCACPSPPPHLVYPACFGTVSEKLSSTLSSINPWELKARKMKKKPRPSWRTLRECGCIPLRQQEEKLNEWVIGEQSDQKAARGIREGEKLISKSDR